ncbi:helix-turn-helix domain-containing protein [Pseudomonas juntendi]|uniref:helix-turn-helix domain-containing protein n=1 Tax=Pseudomonas juntendi TaxID=2666183 RepID=UPI001FFCEF99|nr:helix-turn-helix transcriptional regulator [Pseudomonas juntendi]MCK2111197.1 helix-turn-helix domain-containing protein [Pseudomonas juntendi]
MSDIHQGLGRAIRMLRVQRGLSLEAFADVLERRFLISVEQGRKSLSLRSLAAISSVLQVSPSTLLLLAQAAEAGADPRVIQRHEALFLDALIADGIVMLPIPASDDLIGGVRAKRTDELKQKVQKCQRQGMTKAETVRFLRVARTTVSRYWQ